MQQVSIEYTLTVKTCIDHIAVFLRNAGVEPRGVIARILDEFERKVSAFPLGCQVCPELVNLGVSKYRECNTSDGYRVLYSTDGSTVTGHAVLSQRQDVKQLLFKRLIQA